MPAWTTNENIGDNTVLVKYFNQVNKRRKFKNGNCEKNGSKGYGNSKGCGNSKEGNGSCESGETRCQSRCKKGSCFEDSQGCCKT